MTVTLTWPGYPQVPPLRVRPADVADMAVYFSRQMSKRSAVRQMGLTSGAVRQLESYRLPQQYTGATKESPGSLGVGCGHVVDCQEGERASPNPCKHPVA